MKNLKGLTLIEVIVVIMTIALMITILLPAFTTAANKETSFRAVCANRLKNFGIANTIYSNENEGYFCPIYYLEPNATGTIVRAGVHYDSRNWITNNSFRQLLNIDSYPKNKRTNDVPPVDSTSRYNFPAELLCPADVISIDARNIYGVSLSYGYNITEWCIPGTWQQIFRDNPYMGHNVANIPAPSTKFAFIDAIDWWANWRGANFTSGWDRLGQANITQYKENNIHGPTLYRHNEGANVGFYDGHVGYMKKQVLYNQEDREPFDSNPDPATNTNPRRAGGWVVNMDTYIINGQD